MGSRYFKELLTGQGLTVCRDFSNAKGSPVETEYLVCIGNRAAVECAQHLLCRFVCGKLHKAVALRDRGILIPDDFDVYKLPSACMTSNGTLSQKVCFLGSDVRPRRTDKHPAGAAPSRNGLTSPLPSCTSMLHHALCIVPQKASLRCWAPAAPAQGRPFGRGGTGTSLQMTGISCVGRQIIALTRQS